MIRRELSTADVDSYMNLLNSPVFRWSQTESDDETDEMWLQLCLAILEGIPREMLKWIQDADPPWHAPPLSDLTVESQAIATSILSMLRVAQRLLGGWHRGRQEPGRNRLLGWQSRY